MALSIRKKASLIFDPNDAFMGEVEIFFKFSIFFSFCRKALICLEWIQFGIWQIID